MIEMSASIGGLIVHAVAAKGGDVDALCRVTGFDPKLATDPDARISLALEEALYDEGARLCDDDAFGLHCAELLPPGAFDVLDYACRTAPTLRVALERLVRYNRIVHDAAEFRLVPRGDILRIEHSFRFGTAVQSRHSAELTIAAVLLISRQITETPVQAYAVEFRHARPASTVALAEHQRVFGVAPRFAMPVNAIEIAAASLELPIPNADLRLSKLVERHAETLLEQRVDHAQSTSDRVRHLLGTMLGEGEVSLAAVAAKLKMSERTLQRKLAEDGLSFDALLDDMRKDLAVRYLADPKLAIAEVAYLLGYSEPSPFHRAFKRWTGKTPSEARRAA